VTAELGFGVLAFLLVGFPALRVVTNRDLVRAVLWLAVTLLGTAVLYALLHAPSSPASRCSPTWEAW
jgi:NADH:ubiquinone oxidoreductase subunit 6 (subunit J)